jgi:hypothetical protein
MQLQQGDLVHIRRDPSDHWCLAEALSVSPGSLSLMVSGMVRSGAAGVAGHLNLTCVDHSRYFGFSGDEYKIETLSGDVLQIVF